MSRLPLRALLVSSLVGGLLMLARVDADEAAATTDGVPTVTIPAGTVPATAVEGSAAVADVPVIVVPAPSAAQAGEAAIPVQAGAEAESQVDAEAAAAVAAESDDGGPLPPKPRSGWVARFFWSPEYCNRNRGSREPQCGSPLQGFVLRDLIRVIDGREVDSCAVGTEALPTDILEQMARFTRNKVETRASWRLYGRCSGLSASDYAAWSEFVDRRMVWPELFVPGGRDLQLKAAEITAGLKEENASLGGEAVVLQCNRNWLASVDVCMDGAFNFDKSACPLASSCNPAVKVRGRR